MADSGSGSSLPPTSKSSEEAAATSLPTENDGKTSTARPSPATIPTLNRQPPACLRSDRASQLTQASEDGTGFSDNNPQGTMLQFDETQQATDDFTSVPAISRSLGHCPLQIAEWCLQGNSCGSPLATQLTAVSGSEIPNYARPPLCDPNHAASIEAKERPTPDVFKNYFQNACVVLEPWNSTGYNNENITILCMKSCYLGSIQGGSGAAPYFQRFLHPTHVMEPKTINGLLPHDIGTGFAEVKQWEFRAGTHPAILVWFGKHFTEQRWAPTVLLTFLKESGILVKLKLGEAIISSGKQHVVWPPSEVDEVCGTKLKQVSGDDCISVTRRLKTVQGQNGTQACVPPHKFCNPHLLASMLAYVDINCITMLQRFTPDEVVRVDTDSISIYRTALPKLNSVKDFWVLGFCNCGRKNCVKCLYLPDVPPGHWFDQNLYMPSNEATYDKGRAPPYSDPLTRHQSSYLNGVNGSGNSMELTEVKTRCETGEMPDYLRFHMDNAAGADRFFKEISNDSDPSTRFTSASEEIPKYPPYDPKVIEQKFKNYKHTDREKGMKGFDLTVKSILQLRDKQMNCCADCKNMMLWFYKPNDPRQFSVDRLDNKRGHVQGNVRLTCLGCNLKRGATPIRD